MNREEPGETLRKICPRCGKPEPGGKRSGSLTGYLFRGSECTCALAGGRKQGAMATGTGAAGDADFCPKCGLQIVAQSRDGSITGFMFQSTRCKCPSDLSFAPGVMSDRFWKLKQAGGDSIFSKAAEVEPGKRASIGLAGGAIIGGEYEIIEMLGRGGMGEVYLARHTRLGRKCALKVIPPEQVTEDGWLRFQQEAKAVAKLDHINLVKVTDLGIHDGCLPFYAMDYVEGRNLAELLEERGKLPLNTVLELFKQVCDGLECAHRGGILHRDLKPANIIVGSSRSGPGQAKILDFGLAKLLKVDRAQQSLTLPGDVFGSPFYMSPEQCQGKKLDQRSDIYSLGCTLFECLTGRPPYQGQSVAAIIFGHMEGQPPTLEGVLGPGSLPPAMDIVLGKLLWKDPLERYQTCREVRADLERVARGEDVQPIYVSRSNSAEGRQIAYQGRSAGGAFDSAADAFEEESAQPRSSTGLLIAAGALLLIGGLSAIFVIMQFFHRQSEPELAAKTKQTALVEPFRHKSIAAENDAGGGDLNGHLGPISCGLSYAGGQLVRVFHFPAQSLGRIIPAGAPSFEAEAKGTLVFPARLRLVLTDNRSFDQSPILSNPNVLTRFGVDDLFGLDVSGPVRSGLSRADDDIRPDLVLAVSKWTGLRELGFSYRNLPGETVDALDGLSVPIEILHMRQTKVDLARLAKVKWFKGLRTLDANEVSLIDPLLFALVGAPRLKAVMIDDTEPSRAALEVLKTCPKLKHLEIDSADVDDQKLDTICDIAGLQELTLSGDPLTASGLKKLTRLKKLKYLKLSHVPVSESDVDELRRLMPNCKIY